MLSQQEGYINQIDTLKLGKILVELGGGRKYKEQEINYDVGMIIKVKINDLIKENDLLFEGYSNGPLSKEIKESILSCLRFENKKRKHLKNVYKIMN